LDSAASGSYNSIGIGLKSLPTVHRDPKFALAHVDVEAELTEAEGRLQLALRLVDY
jgi:hypothetical protein